MPPDLEPFRDKIVDTRKAVIRVLPQSAIETTLWQSKIGGKPYLPKGSDFPTNPEGEQLFFLAQINFAETPPLPGFPTQGLLQFFIFDDDFYGQNIDHPTQQDHFRLLYFPAVIEDVAQLVTDFSFLRAYEEDMPIAKDKSFPVLFMPEYELLPVDDYRFEETFGAGFFEQFGDQEWEMYEHYVDLTFAEGHKIGGYPDFAQKDPRRADDPMELLFQIDSDDAIDCMWGDMGVANFFIRPTDLAQLDFSNVMYNWDCC